MRLNSRGSRPLAQDAACELVKWELGPQCSCHRLERHVSDCLIFHIAHVACLCTYVRGERVRSARGRAFTQPVRAVYMYNHVTCATCFVLSYSSSTRSRILHANVAARYPRRTLLIGHVALAPRRCAVARRRLSVLPQVREGAQRAADMRALLSGQLLQSAVPRVRC